MAQATSIVLADGQTTPVNTTFTPEQISPAYSAFVDRSTGVATRFRRLVVRYDPSKASRPYTKTTFDVSLPVYGTLPSGANGIIYTLRARGEYQLPDGCTDAERKDLLAFVKNGLANSLILGAVRDNDPLY